jgi:pyrroline-5-carboxylate reductase
MSNNTHSNNIAFIGGGNMASAIIGGLLKQGLLPAQIQVVEPFEAQRLKLVSQFGIEVHAAPSDSLLIADMLVWAVKPQMFREAAMQTRSHCPKALHLSVAAGVRSDSIAHWLGSQSIVRAMPNTPALIGKGMTALYARAAVTPVQKQLVDSVIATTGAFLWLDDETQLDAVTALSGSGPAYVFYFIESMVEAGVQMGLSAAQAQQLAIGTFVGASELASTSAEPPQILRERVTSKGGTTYAALTSMEQSDIKALFIRAMQAAQQRAAALGDEFGKL